MTAVIRNFLASTDSPRFPWRLWEESTFTAAFLTVAHLGAAALGVLSLHAADRLTRAGVTASIAFASIFGLLAVDRFFGLLPRLVRRVRFSARAGGWYWPWRRPLQVLGVLLSLVTVVLLVQWISRLDLPLPDEIGCLFAGYSLVFVLLRSISLHEFDMILFRRRAFLGRRTLHPLLELVGPLGVSLALLASAL